MSRNARLGLVLFFIYLAFYGGFVLLNTFRAQLMELTPFGGVNLAILYGFGLIVLAFLMAMIYGALCRDEAAPVDTASHKDTHS